MTKQKHVFSFQGTKWVRPYPKIYWQFNITKWDETGNVLLERHVMTVQRQSQYNARTVVRKRFPWAQGYREEVNEISIRHQ